MPAPTAPGRSRRWQLWSATRGCWSARCGRAWAGWKPRGGSRRTTLTLSRRGSSADRRPQGWDLDLRLVRADLDDADVAVLQHQFPGLGARMAGGARTGDDGEYHEVQPLHPVSAVGEVVDNWQGGMQPAQPRGAAHPNRTKNRPLNRPPSRLVRAMSHPPTMTGSAAVRWASSSTPSAMHGG